MNWFEDIHGKLNRPMSGSVFERLFYYFLIGAGSIAVLFMYIALPNVA
jgi:hypothetical protein